MKTIKRKPSRMRRAVRSVAVLLCVLAAYVVLSGMKLTPRAAIRMGEQYYGIYEPTHTVAMQRMRVGGRSCRVYLTAGENSLYCGAARLTPSGWDIIFMGNAIACTDGESVHAGWWDMARNGAKDVFYWGRVDDAAITSAVIERYRAVSQDENGEYTFEKRAAFAAELIEDGDYRYFLTGGVVTGPNYDDLAWDRVYFVGYDASGAEVLRYEIERQMSTSFA